MRTPRIAIVGLLAVYLASGFYVVRGNEQVVLLRFGRAVPGLLAGGLYYDLPWPFASVHRINVHELRTLVIGIAPTEAFDGAGFLSAANLDRQGEFLTGDKNVLNLQVNVHYAIDQPHRFLFGSKSPEIGLKLLAESLITETVANSSVDYVHPLGLSELQVLLTRSLREAARQQEWGVAVDNVAIAGVLPPVEVKAAFLDVSNARAERDRGINEEEARAEKLLAGSGAAARQIRDRAEADRLSRVEAARGSADRFLRVIAQFQPEAKSGAQGPQDVRRATMRRLLAAALEELLPRLGRKVVVDPDQPVDLSIFAPQGEERGPRAEEKRR
jgi:membrane protease subunit HflK